MDNQQERRAVVGGLITGEGGFHLGVETHRNLRIKPIFQMKMADKETMEFVIDYFKSAELSLYRLDDGPFIRIRADGLKRTKRVIEHFLPVLTGTKRQAASIVLRYIQSRESKESQSPYSGDEIRMVELLRSINGVRNGKKNQLPNPQRLYARRGQ
jgi:hypothetical protein